MYTIVITVTSPSVFNVFEHEREFTLNTRPGPYLASQLRVLSYITLLFQLPLRCFLVVAFSMTLSTSRSAMANGKWRMQSCSLAVRVVLLEGSLSHNVRVGHVLCREHALTEIAMRRSCLLRCHANVRATALLPVKATCALRDETLNGTPAICR